MHNCSSNDLTVNYAHTEWADHIRIIKRRFRLAMDGVVSTSLRERGMFDYRVIFGCSMHSLKRIAQEVPHESGLADYLWQENVRESKILATMIHPIDLFDRAKAERWLSQIPFMEISEHLAMNLICRVDFAIDLSLMKLKDPHQLVQATALHTLQRLSIGQRESMSEAKSCVIEQLLAVDFLLDMPTIGELYLNVWKRLLRVDPMCNEVILQSIRQRETLESSRSRRLIAALQEELEYI